MANISDDTLDRLIDKIGRLTWVMERQSRRSDGGSKDTYSSRNMNYDYYDDEREEFEDLSGRQTTKVKKKKERKSKALQEEIDALEKNGEEIENENRPKIEELKRRKASTLLLDEQAKYQEEINQLESEIAKVEKKRLDKIREKDELDSKSLKEYYDTIEKPRTEPKEGTKKAWRGLSKKEKEEYGSFDNYRQSVKDKRSQKFIDKYNLDNTAFGRYARNRINFNTRIRDYGRMGDAMQGKAGKSIATSIFGDKGLGKMATKALGGFGKGLAVASKLLGGPWVQAIMVAIDALHMIGDAVGEWKKHNAKIIEFQTRYEELTYEHDKQIANLQAEQQVVDIEYEKDVQMKMMEVQGQNLLEASGIQNKQLINSVNAAVGGMTQGIMQTAYQSAANMVDYQADALKSQRAREVRGAEQERYEKVRGAEYSRDKELNKAEQNIVDVHYEVEATRNQLEKEHYLREKVANAADFSKNGFSVTGIAGGVSAAVNTDSTDTASFENGKVGWGSSQNNINPVTGKAIGEAGRFNNNNGWNTAGTAVTGALLGANFVEAKNAEEKAQFDNAAKSLERTADYQKQAIDNYYKVSIAEQKGQKELLDEQAELGKSYYEQQVDTLAEMRKIWLNVAQEIETYWLDVDKATNRASLNQGILDKGQRTDFQKYLNDIANTVGYAYGKNGAEIAAMQTAYSESTGRNKTLDKGDYEKALYMGTRLGDENLVAEYGAGMEIFNHGVENSVDLLDEALDNVNRVGLNGKKYAKDLVSNLKLAQKYNFKGGTKELMQMAKWAQQTRFNLSSLSGMIDKVQEGGLEGVITQSAGFQVLGGQAAINSDPLGMMFDAWADPQAYAKRMQDMTKGFGRFNSKTGETEFNINESMQIAQLAKLQGRSAEELRGEIMQRNKQNSVNQQLDKYAGFNDEQKAMISNKAEYKDGKWIVKMNNGDDKEVSTLSKTDLENLMPKGHEERMEALQKEGVGYLRDLVDYQTKYQGEQNLEKGMTLQESWSQMQKEVEERIKNSHESFIQNFDTNLKNIKTAMTDATNSQKDLLTLYKDNATAMANKQNEMSISAGKFQESLDKLSEVIDNAITKIDKSAVIEHKTLPTPPSGTPETQNVREGNPVSPFAPSLMDAREETEDYNNFRKKNAKDAFSSAQGKPMYVSASQVTPVSDGEAKIAKTDPNDTALFAKTGGPFDKLFDGIFSKVSETYSFVTNMQETNSQISGLITNNSYDMKTGFESVIEQTNQNAKSIQFITDTLFSGVLFDDSEIINVLSDIDTEVKKLDIDRRDIRSFSEKNTFEKITDAIFHPFNTFSSISSNNSSTTNKKYGVNISNGGDVSNEFMPKFYKAALAQSIMRSYYENSPSSTSMYNNRYMYDTRNGVNMSNQSNKYTSRTYGGDSLSMAYDTWTDPQANVRRLNDIARGLGRVNPKTGETEFNIIESMQIGQLAKLQGRSADELKQDITQRNNLLPQTNDFGYSSNIPYSASVNSGSSDNRITLSDLNLNINGKIELTGQDGQTVNIIDELKQNPMFIRQITEMIVLQMNNNANGGRNNLFNNRFSRV